VPTTTTSGDGGNAVPALDLRGLTKRFGDTPVLADVSLSVAAGEVHALVGSNGSGKSTLVKVVTGVYPPTEVGALRVAGEDARLPITRRELDRLGVRVVHQSLGLVDALDVAENVALGGGFVTSGPGAIRWRETRRRVRATLERLGVDVPLGTPVGELAAWERVAVAVARVFYGDLDVARLVLLDEVTAAMPREEVARLFDLIGRLTAGDVGVLYVTHRFEEIFAIAGRATVIRDGRVVETKPTSELTAELLVSALTGAAASPSVDAHMAASRGAAASVEVSDLQAKVLAGVSLSARAGEIIGVTGRAGCGRSELGRVLCGLQPATGGTIRYAGYEGDLNPRSLIAAGIAYVPQDRHRDGLLTGGTIRENLTLPSLEQCRRGLRLDGRRERALAADAIAAYGVRPAAPERPVDTLSGGNQQKVMLARWLTRRPTVIVLDEPTEGVDVPARTDIYTALRRCAAEGTTVLVLSSSAEEIVELCDRALVLDEGRVVAEVDGSHLSVTRLNQFSAEGAHAHA
jgi:ribose transport system ATP-binding protein